MLYFVMQLHFYLYTHSEDMNELLYSFIIGMAIAMVVLA